MTPDSILEQRLVESMAGVAASGSPDYIDDILGRSGRTRQRRARVPWQRSAVPTGAPHLHPGWWTRRSLMTRMLGVSAAVLLVAAFVAWLGPRDPSTQYGAADPSPSATPAPLHDGPLSAGSYAVRPFSGPGSDACGEPSDPICDEGVPDDTIGVTFTVPEGWSGRDDSINLTTGFGQTLDGAAMIFSRGGSLYDDPCEPFDNVHRIPVGPTARDFADALADHPLLDVTAPVEVSVGGYRGWYLDLQVPDDPTIQGSNDGANLPGCPIYQPWFPWYFARMGGERWLLWILDVDDHRVVVQGMVHPETTHEVEEQLRQIVESMGITPAAAPRASPSPAPLAWSRARVEQDWPAPVREEPVGEPVLIPFDDGSLDYHDPQGDIQSPDMPWVDIVRAEQGDCSNPGGVCAWFAAGVPGGLMVPDDPWIAFGLVSDTDLDGVADVRLGVDRVPARLPVDRGRATDWTPGGSDTRAWRTDLRTGVTEYGEAGSLVCDCGAPDEDGRLKVYPHEAMIPGRFYLWASAIQDGQVVATDYAPDAGWFEVSAP